MKQGDNTIPGLKAECPICGARGMSLCSDDGDIRDEVHSERIRRTAPRKVVQRVTQEAVMGVLASATRYLTAVDVSAELGAYEQREQVGRMLTRLAATGVLSKRTPERHGFGRGTPASSFAVAWPYAVASAVRALNPDYWEQQREAALVAARERVACLERDLAAARKRLASLERCPECGRLAFDGVSIHAIGCTMTTKEGTS